MIVGIMQPYLFPYLEQFRLMDACDHWVVFDRVKYQRRSWMNRNRLLDRHRPEGWSYFTVPVTRCHEDEPVSDVRLADAATWRTRLLDRLRVYEAEAPFYQETRSLVESVVTPPCHRLIDLNVAALVAIRDRLGITTEICRLSELDVELPASCAPGAWALHIARALGAREYRNPSGGRQLFDPQAYRDAGVMLSFHEHADISYPTGRFRFVPDLSVIDALMWLGADGVRAAALRHHAHASRAA